MRDKILNDFGWREAAKPDSSSSSPASPEWHAREVAAQFSLITVQPTSGGSVILNANGSIVQ